MRQGLPAGAAVPQPLATSRAMVRTVSLPARTAPAPLVDTAFLVQVATILGTAMGAGLYAQQAGWLLAVPIPAHLHLVGTADLMRQLLSLAAGFQLLTHVRALWCIPLWTKRYNIFLDASFGLGGITLAGTPSVAALLYFWVHAGFLVMRLADERRFRGLFTGLADSDYAGPYAELPLLRALSWIATLFEIGVQLMFVLSSPSLMPPVIGAMLFFACCSSFEESTES